MPRAVAESTRKYLSILGPLVLLAAWLTQTFLFDRWNGELSRLDSAEVVWDVYRSNHYALNALRTDQNNAQPSYQDENVIRWQKRNLEVATERIQSAVDASAFEQIRREVSERRENKVRLAAGTEDGQVAVTIEIFKATFTQERMRLAQRKNSAQQIFWLLYALGTTMTIAATVLKESSASAA